jgi:ribosomal protein S18 acetylase RimI-like enzyme
VSPGFYTILESSALIECIFGQLPDRETSGLAPGSVFQALAWLTILSSFCGNTGIWPRPVSRAVLCASDVFWSAGVVVFWAVNRCQFCPYATFIMVLSNSDIREKINLRSRLMNFTLRKATIDDFETLYRINKEAYQPYVEQIWGWNEEFQYTFFKEHLILDRIELIIVDGTPVGFISLNYREDLIFGESIALLPEFQSKGIGAKIIKDLIVKSKQLKIPFHIQVFKINVRAKALYERLGFTQYGENETHYKYVIKPCNG